MILLLRSNNVLVVEEFNADNKQVNLLVGLERGRGREEDLYEFCCINYLSI